MKSMQKLASGKQINRASDNAAGKTISKKMRAQIRGLQQAEKLGLNKVDVLSHETTMASLVLIDDISKIISSRRGEYGAYQNRLEHALANCQNYEVNLANALSGIEDVDMAKEAQQLAKNNILLKSSQTMITQINQMSKGILENLKKSFSV